MLKKFLLIATHIIFGITLLNAGIFWGFDSGYNLADAACEKEFKFAVEGDTTYLIFYKYYAFLVFTLLVIAVAQHLRKYLWLQIVTIIFSVISLINYINLYLRKIRYLDFFSQGDGPSGNFEQFVAIIRKTIITDEFCAVILVMILGFQIYRLIIAFYRGKQPAFT